MGNFYVNFTLNGATQKAVVDALAGRSAIVTPASNSCVVVYDQEADEQDPGVMESVAEQLSGTLQCPVLAVMNHDDDILAYFLYEAGSKTDEYNSSPGYFDDAEDADGPEGGDATKLCAAFGSSNVSRVEQILKSDDYTFAVERHSALVEALGLSDFAVGAGYNYISEGELPGALSEDDLMQPE